jgi:hypothetical protein
MKSQYLVSFVFLALYTVSNSYADLSGQPYDRQWIETFSGPQSVWKSPVLPQGAPADQLVLQPDEVRTWSFVYLFKDKKQINEFISIDIRKRVATGEIFRRICNHYINPIPLGRGRYAYTVVDMGKKYDPSCTDAPPAIGPRRIIAEWKQKLFSPIRIVKKFVWSNFIAGSSANMMVYANFTRKNFDRTLVSNISFPVADDSTDMLEIRHVEMKLQNRE